MTDLSSYHVTGTNNPNKQVSVTRHNSMVDAIGNAITDVETDVAARPTSAALAASTGAALIGETGGGTLQAKLNALDTADSARPTSATLAATGGAALIGAISDKTGAGARTQQAKNRDIVSIKDLSVVGDGTDESATIQAAMASARTGQFRLNLPEGTYKVTSGYTNSLAGSALRIRGEGRNALLGQVAPTGTVLKLDSASAASFFYAATGTYTALDLEGVIATTAQTVTDRKFFKFSGIGPIRANGFEFDGVEKPLAIEVGGYAQSCALRDGAFNDSGTIHCEVGDAGAEAAVTFPNTRGTLWLLDNISHDGSVPANTEKIVMNLYGLREVNARNLLLEGALPAANYTVLKIGNPVDPDWARREFFHCWNFHSEWTGTQPDYVVDQLGGTARFDHITTLSATSKYRVQNDGKAIIGHTSFSEYPADPSTYFEREDSQCLVKFENCGVRVLDFAQRGFIHRDTQLVSSTAGVGNCVLSNTASRAMWRFDGGVVETGGDLNLGVNNTTPYSSTDATYGRKWVVPSAADFYANIRILSKGLIVEGDQVYVMAKVKLPTFTGGTMYVALNDNAGTDLNFQTFATAYSAQIVDVLIPYTRKAGDTSTSYGILIYSSTATGISGDVEFLALEIGIGRDLPQVLLPHYPRNIVTHGAAAPTTGGWAQGDVVWNTGAAAGGSPGWICTTAGTPGTWKAMAAVAA